MILALQLNRHGPQRGLTAVAHLIEPAVERVEIADDAALQRHVGTFVGAGHFQRGVVLEVAAAILRDGDFHAEPRHFLEAGARAVGVGAVLDHDAEVELTVGSPGFSFDGHGLSPS